MRFDLIYQDFAPYKYCNYYYYYYYYLRECHLALGDQVHLLGLGWVGVVLVTQQPLFQWACHVLQSLTLVARFLRQEFSETRKQTEKT